MKQKSLCGCPGLQVTGASKDMCHQGFCMEDLHQNLLEEMWRKEGGGEGEGRNGWQAGTEGCHLWFRFVWNGCVFSSRESKSLEHAHNAMMARSNGLNHQQLWVKSHSLGRERNLSPSWVCSADVLLVWFSKCLSPPLLGFLCLLLESEQVKFKPGFHLRRYIYTSQKESSAAGRGWVSHTQVSARDSSGDLKQNHLILKRILIFQ